MSYSVLLLSTLVLTMAYLFITWLARKKVCHSIFERIIFFILKAALSFAIVFIALYVAMKKLYSLYGLAGYESAKTIVLSMIVLSFGMAALAFVNLKTVERIRKKR